MNYLERKSRSTLIMLPFAGGNKYSYRFMKPTFPSILDLVCLEYPGRGCKSNISFPATLNDLVSHLLLEVRELVDGIRYSIYGHSLGGLIAYLMAKNLSDLNLPPTNLFVSGVSAPCRIESLNRNIHLLAKVEFLKELKEIGGLPPEFYSNWELVEYFEPIIRADFKLMENYCYIEGKPINIKTIVMTGTEEDVCEKDIRPWQNESTEKVDFYNLKGNHFFIYDNKKVIAKIIKSYNF